MTNNEINKREIKISNQMTILKNKRWNLKKQKFYNLLNNKYVIFAYAKSVFTDPETQLQYYYYCNPLSLQYHGMDDGQNPEHETNFTTKPMNNQRIKFHLEDLIKSMSSDVKQTDHYGDKKYDYFFFTKSQIHKIIRHAPTDMRPVLKAGVHHAKFVLTHGNNSYVLDDEYK